MDSRIAGQTIRSIITFIIAMFFCHAALLAGQKVAEETVQGKLIAGFPSFPIYPGAKVVESERLTEGTKVGFEAELITNDSVQDSYSYYLRTLKRDGWKIIFASSNSSTAEEQGLGAEKDAVRVYIEFEEENGKTEIEIEFPLQEWKKR